MWKKLREASSGMTLNSVTNLFRSKSYAKFGSNDDHCNEPSNNSVTGGIEDTIDVKPWPHDTPVSVQSVESMTDNVSSIDDDLSDNDEYGFEEPRHVQNTQRFRSSDETSDNNTMHSRVLVHKYDNGHVVPNPKSEVKELVNSFAQRRYQPLEDSDESSETCHDSTLTQKPEAYHGNTRTQKPEDDLENCVFHRAEDVHENVKQKSSRTKKAKKIAKRARRILGRSWKWIRRGFSLMGFAQGAQFTNVYILVNKENRFSVTTRYYR